MQSVRKTCLKMALVIVYIIGVGITAVCMCIYYFLIGRRRERPENTFWCSPHGYEPDADNSLRQS